MDVFFTTEEKVLINGGFKGASVAEFTLPKFLEYLSFQREIAAPEILPLINGLAEKVIAATAEQWQELVPLLPFPLPLQPEDIVPDTDA